MGWKSGAAAGAAGGMLFGPIGAGIGAAIGGAIGAMCDDDTDTTSVQIPEGGGDEVSVYLTDQGLSFPIADMSVRWEEVEKVEFDRDDGNDAYTLVGGLLITCASDRVKFISDDEEDSDRINKRIRNRQVSSIKDLFEDMRDDEPTDNVLSAANKSVVSIAICKELLPHLQQDENLIVDFEDCPNKLYAFSNALRERYLRTFDDPYDFDEDTMAIRNWATESMDVCVDLSRYFADAIANDEVYSEHPDQLKIKAGLLAEFELLFRYLLHNEHDFDKTDYAMYQTSVSTEDSADKSLGYNAAVEWLAFEFTKEEFERERKIIVCTEEPRALGQMGVEVQGVAILRAETLEAANNKIREYDEEEETERYLSGLGDDAEDVKHSVAVKKGREAYEARLERAYQFEMGHPRNGVTYVQHPIEKNMYVDINSFNTTLLERKYDELIRVLSALGATSISCSVMNDKSNASKRRGKRGFAADASCVYGSVSGSFDDSSLSERTFALNKKLSCRIKRTPKQKPYLPADTVFFRFEDRWRQMANDVLSGQRTREEVDLSYRKEYSLSCNEARQIGTKLETLIPGFQFGGSANYSDEYEAELKELESIVWHYEVEFGGVESAEVETMSEKVDDSRQHGSRIVTVDVGKAETMIHGRAKRYAKTEEAKKSGMLTDVQRADLEKLASKYGVDDLRLEELIDEAFLACD